MEREAGLPLSLPPSSSDVRLEVEEAELGRGLVGSLVTSRAGVLVSTCADREARSVCSLLVLEPLQLFDSSSAYLVQKLGVAGIELQRELPEAMRQRRQVDSVRPASHQAAPQHLGRLQVEGTAGCTHRQI